MTVRISKRIKNIYCEWIPKKIPIVLYGALLINGIIEILTDYYVPSWALACTMIFAGGLFFVFRYYKLI